ncbi:MAG TPA: hypothetical protein VK961_24290 [Chthoniobacter sp.]|nr:hypothetical protein [Chthoniobacter sp.]
MAEEPPSEEAPAATPQPATTPEPKPVAMATPTPPPATPAPELAPPGVFYLITAVSVETSDGILGLKPGQPLREVRPGVYRADANEVTLRADQVTNDLAIARRFAAQDQVNQAAIQQRLASPSSSSMLPKSSSASPTSSSSAPPPPSQDDAKTRARQELMQQRMVIQRQSDALAVTLNQVSARFGNWDYAAKKSPQAYQLLQQFNGLRRQVADLDTQIAAIH